MSLMRWLEARLSSRLRIKSSEWRVDSPASVLFLFRFTVNRRLSVATVLYVQSKRILVDFFRGFFVEIFVAIRKQDKISQLIIITDDKVK